MVEGNEHTSVDSLSPGTKVGSYESLALLDAGGMGEVYRARDSGLGRDVAIKVLAPIACRTSTAAGASSRKRARSLH